MVLDTELVRDPSNYSPVILGRPFFATADAVIRCRNRVMTLLFGNMTVELNVFHTSFQPHVIDDYEEVNMIDVWSITLLRGFATKTLWRNAWPILE